MIANPASTTDNLARLQREWRGLHEVSALAPGSQAPGNQCSNLLLGKSMNWGKGPEYSNCNHYYYIDASGNKLACRLDGRGCAPRSRWRAATKPYDEEAAIEALRQQIGEGTRRRAEVERDQGRAVAEWQAQQKKIARGRMDVEQHSSAEANMRTGAAQEAVAARRGLGRLATDQGAMGTRGGKRRKSRRRNTRHRRKSHGRKRVHRRRTRVRGRRRTRR